MSELGDIKDDGNRISPASNPAADRDPDQDLAASVAGDSVAGTTTAAAANPRKRKKSSRASVPFHPYTTPALPLVQRLTDLQVRLLSCQPPTL